jgi:hypothetical protein
MKDKASSLAILFSWFQVPPSKADDEKQKLVQQFEYICKSFSDKAVYNAVEDFVNGRVENQNGTWLPQPTEFGMQCRKYAAYEEMETRRNRIAQESALSLPKPQETSPERRAEIVEEVMAKHNAWYDCFKSQDKPEQKFTPITADTIGDPRPLAERLNIRDVVPAHYSVPETKSAPQAKSLADATPKVAAE